MSDALEVDLVVVGGGMTGMSAAGYAAERGLSVVVIEKAPDIGGSAVLSNGTVWTAETLEIGLKINPLGDPELVKVLVGDYDDGIEWLRTTGTTMSGRQTLEPMMGYPTKAYTIDVLGYMQRMKAKVLAANGWVVTDADVRSLLTEDGRVVGVVVEDRDGVSEVRAPWTLLASGGFQNDAELRSRFMGAQAESMIVRSNQQSAGTGLRLGQSVGAALSVHMNSFYGHTMPTPLHRKIEPRDYLRLAQLYSHLGVLLDNHGNRFVDESIAYHNNGRAVFRRASGRALLVGDNEIRELDRSGYGVAEQIDRPAEAAKEGANVAFADSFEELEAKVEPWGYRDLARAVTDFNTRLAADPESLDPPRARFRKPLSAPPFFAVEVQSAVTFTMGGLRIDPNAHVLREDGAPIPGLLAGGADAGGLYHDAYLGGLSMGLAFGRRAAKVALGEA